MKNILVYLTALILITSCSSGDGVAPETEPINTLESQIVGKTFWRFIEGNHNDPPIKYLPHFFGIEFNEDGNIYSRYCADSLNILLNTEFNDSAHHVGYDNEFITKYIIQDSLIILDHNYFSDFEIENSSYWLSSISETYQNTTISEYQSVLYYCDYIGIDPSTSSNLDLEFIVRVKSIDKFGLDLIWSGRSADLFGRDSNSVESFFNSFSFYEAGYNINTPNCDEYPIYQ
jgi:hypothetical protein